MRSGPCYRPIGVFIFSTAIQFQKKKSNMEYLLKAFKTIPTKPIIGNNVFDLARNDFTEFGSRALIVTGKSSAKRCGAYDELVAVLDSLSITHSLFDRVEPNPTVESVRACVAEHTEPDFIVAIGGGSPIDAAKAIAIAFKGNLETGLTGIIAPGQMVPLVAVPTTAGTGTEATPYSVLTFHSLHNKVTIPERVFPTLSLMDPRFFMTQPAHVTVSTVLDAFTHNLEGYMGARATPVSDEFALRGIALFGATMGELNACWTHEPSPATRAKWMEASTLGGLTISIAATSLPHGMGYALTYNNGVPHGVANIATTIPYLRLCQTLPALAPRVAQVLELVGCSSLEEFDAKIKAICRELLQITLSAEQIEAYSEMVSQMKGKLASHPGPTCVEDFRVCYKHASNQ